MKNLNKTINVSQTKAILENYAKEIVKILEEKRGISLKKDASFSWEIYIDKKDYPNININVLDIVDNNNLVSVILYVKIHFQRLCQNEKVKTELESKIRKEVENKVSKKYPLSDIHFLVDKENPKIPSLEPAEEVAEQLYLATTCYNKIIGPTISKIKMAQKRIDELYKKETDEITESFFFQ